MKTTITWILIGILTLGIGLGGVFKVFQVEFFVKNAEALHYSAQFGQLIGLFEVLGCAGLYFKRFRVWALLGLCAILFGAVGVSVGAQAPFHHHFGAAIPLGLCILTLILDDSYSLSINV